jgi:hypothetical protein
MPESLKRFATIFKGNLATTAEAEKHKMAYELAEWS